MRNPPFSQRFASRTLRATIWFLAVILLAIAPQARGATYTWAVSSGDWWLASNWGTGVPGAADSAYITNGGTAAVTSLSSTGDICNYLYLGGGTNGNSTLQMLSSTLTVAGSAAVGVTNTGTFLQSGGTNTINGNLDLGYNSGVSGIYNLSSAAVLWAANENVGLSGSGAFIQVGGTNISVGVDLGFNSGASGTYTLGGSGLLSTYGETVGGLGSGTFTQSGGTNSISSSSGLYVGFGPGSSGAYVLSGSGLLSAGSEYVGYLGSGTLTQSGGTNTVSSTFSLGGTGTYNLTGGALILPGIQGNSGTFNLGGGTLVASAGFSASQALILTGSGGNGSINNGGYAVTLSGLLSGTGGLTATGSSALTLTASNIFSGNTLIGGGTLALGNALALQDSALDTSGAGHLSFGSFTAATFGGLVNGGSLSLTNSAGSAVALSVGNNGNNTTYSGILLGSGGSLAKIGGGTLTLTGSNAYAGPTTISAGTLQVGSGGSGASIRSTSSVLDNASLVFNHGDSVTFSPVVSGSGGLTQMGTGTLTLLGSNSYSGSTTIAAGTLKLDFSQSAAPANNIINSLSDSSTLALGGGALAIQGKLNTSNSQQFNGLTVNPGCSAIVLSSSTSNPLLLSLGNITRSVAGGTVDFTLSSGTISTSSANNNGIVGGFATVSGTSWATISGGNIIAYSATSGNYQSGDLGQAPSNGALNVAPSGSQSFVTSADSFNTLNLAGTVGVTMSGSGSLTLLGGGLLANTSGSISGGTLAGSAGGDLVVITPQSLTIGSVIVDNGGPTGLTKAGAAMLTLAGSNTYSGATTIGGGTLQVGSGAAIGGTGSVLDNGSLVFNHSDSAAFAAVISGPGSLTQTGTGILTLLGSNSYTGGTTIGGGLLQVGNPAALGSATAALTLSGGTLDLHGFSLSLGSLAGGGMIDNLAGAGSYALGVGYDNSSSTYSGTLQNTSGQITLTKAGTGLLTLLGNNTYSGSTTILAGTLQVGNGGSGAAIGGANSLLDNGSLVFNHGDSVTFSPLISGSGSLTQTGTGVLTLLASNIYSGATTISGGTLQVGNGASGEFLASPTVSLGSGAALVFNHTDLLTYSGLISGAGSLTQTGTGVLTLLGSNTYTGGTNVSAGTLQVGNGTSGEFLGSVSVSLSNNAVLLFNHSDALTYSGAISGAGGLTQTGTGILTLLGVNTYSGSTTLTAGELSISASTNLGAAGSPVVFNGGILQITGAAVTNLGSHSVNWSTFNGGFDIANTATVFTGSNAISGPGSLSKLGAGTLLLTASNSYNGGTTISAGTLQIGNGTSGEFLGSPTVSLGSSAALVFNHADALTCGGLISGSGNLTQMGTGILTFPGANTYSGGTTISSGSLVLNNANAVQNSTVTVSANNGLVFNSNSGTIPTFNLGGLAGNGNIGLADGTYPITLSAGGNGAGTIYGGVLSGSGGLAKAGTGTLALTGSDTYTGGTTISAGVLQVGNSAALGAATAEVTIGGGILDLHGYNVSLGSLAGGGTIDNLSGTAAYTLGVGYDNSSSTFAGTLQNTSGQIVLVKAGTGTLTLTGNVNLGGSCTVSGGLSQPAGSSVFASSFNLGYSPGSSSSCSVSGFGLLSAANGYVGYSGSGAFTQSGGSAAFATSLNLGYNLGSAGTFNLSGTGGLWAGDEYVGNSGSGTLTQSGGTNSSIGLNLGYNPNSSGSYVLSGSGVLSVYGETVGGLGSGTLTQSGGTNNISSYSGLYVGFGPGSNGSYNFSGAGLLSATNASEYVGYSGTGAFTQSIGTNNVNGGSLYLGNSLGSSGSYNLNGAALLSATSASLYVGYSGTGAFTQSAGTSNLAGSNLYLGYNANSSGTFSLSGSGVLSAASSASEYVGYGGAGTFAQSGGTNSLPSGSLYLGYSVGGSGSYSLSGTGSLLSATNTASEYVGYGGAGTFAQSGGSNSLPSGSLYLGYSVGGSGSYSLSGTGSLLSVTNTASEYVGYGGAGTFTQSGGTNNLPSGNLYLGYSLGGSGSYNLSGAGVLSATNASEYVGYSGTGAFTQSGGTNNLSQGSLYLGNSNSLSSNGAYNLSGSGSLTATNEYVGGSAMGTFSQSGGTNKVNTAFSLGSSGTYNLTGGELIVGDIPPTGGVFTLGGGTLVSNGTSFSTSQAMTLTGSGGNGTINTNSTTVTLSGLLSGPGGLIKSGFGNLVLTASNNFSGNTLTGTGLIVLGNSAALQDSTLDTSGGSLSFGSLTTATFGGLINGGSQSLTNTAGSAVALSVGNNGNSTTYSGILSGGGRLVKIGSGMLTLAGVNTYTGSTTISAGTLQVGNGGSGATIGSTSSVLDNGSLVFNHGDSVTFSPLISGSGSLTQMGTGLLMLTNSNTFSGGTTILAGTLSLNNAYALQDSTVSVNNNNSLLFNSNSGAIPAFSVGALAGSGNFSLSDGTNAITLSAGGDGASTLYSGGLSGSGGLTKTGTGLLTLAGINTYSGSTTLTAGELSISASNNLPASGPVVFNGGILQITGTAPTSMGSHAVNWSTYNGGFDIANAANVFTVGNAISGPGGLSKLGAGMLVLTGSNTYSGGTTLSGGELSISASGNLGVSGGSLTFNGGILQITGTAVSSLAGYTVNWSTFNGGFDIASAANVFTAGSAIGGTGGLSKLGAGMLVLTGSNTYSGGTTISAGALALNNANAVQYSTVTVNNNNGLVFNSNSGAFTTFNLGGLAGSGNFSLSDGTWAITLSGGGNGASTIYSGGLSGTGGLTKTGLGILTLAGINSYSGSTTLTAGELSISASNNLPVSGPVVFNGGTLQVTGTAVSSMGSRAVNWSSFNGGFDIANAANVFTVSNAIGGTGGLTKAGGGTLVLCGSDSYTGGTTIAAGMLKLDFSQAGAPTSNIVNNVSNSSSLTLDGGTLAMQGKLSTTDSQQFNGVTINPGCSAIVLTASSSNPLLLSMGSISRNTVGGTVDFTLPSGVLSGSNGITTSNANTSAGILGAYATVSGGTGWAVSNGTSSITAYAAYTYSNLGAQASGANLNVSPSGTQTAVTSADSFYTLNLTGTEAVTMSGTGALTLLGGGLIGNTTGSISGGTLEGSASGELIVFTPQRLAIGSVIANNGGATALTKAGSGTLTLTASNTYTGVTTIGGGVLQVSGSGALGTGPVTDNSSLVINLSGAPTFGGTVSGVGSLTQAGAGILTLTGSDTYTGGTIVNTGGTLKLGASTALPSGTATTVNGTLDLSSFAATLGALSGAGTVNYSGTGSNTLTVGSGNASGTFDGTIESSGGTLGLLKIGSGQLILSGTDSYSGGTTVSAGALYVTAPSALPAGTGLTVAPGATFVFDPAATGGSAATVSGDVAPRVFVVAVPEPGTLVLLLAAIWSAVIYRRFSRRPLPW